MRPTLLALTLCIGLAPVTLLAQKSAAIGEPLIWSKVAYDRDAHVFFDKDKNPTKEYWKIPSGASNKKEEWRVFTDRDQVRVLSEPEEAASEVKKFDFGQILWVAADKGEYVKVMESSGAAAVGWCHKRDLILWTEPLVDPKTSIEIKAFIVNTPKAIERLREGGSKESYKIYSSPHSNATTLQERAIYDVLFVYKYAPSEDGVKDGRYLVSLNARLSGSQKLWGWVEENRIKLWDTRLCLEPNFDPAAIAERRTKDIATQLFLSTDGGTSAYLKSGTGEGLLGKTADPAFGDDPERNPRMSGSLFRYPVFDAVRGELGINNCLYVTGVSGRNTLGSSGVLDGFNGSEYVTYSKALEKFKEKAENVNVIFLIDGGSGGDALMAAARGCLQKIGADHAAENTWDYGAVVYRQERAAEDVSTNPKEEYCESFPLTRSYTDLLTTLGPGRVRSVGDLVSGRRAVNFGMKEALSLVQNNETNIIIHLGRIPDNSSDDLFMGKTLVESADLADDLTMTKGVHYLSYVPYLDAADGTSATRRAAYEWYRDEIMTNLAIRMSNLFKGIVNFVQSGRLAEAPQPVVSSSLGMEVTRMVPSPFMMKTHFSTTLDQNGAQLRRSILLNVDSCVAQVRAEEKLMQQYLEDKSAVSDRANDFMSPYVMQGILAGIPAEKHADLKKHLAAEKVHIFVDGKTYYRIEPISTPLFRYVLFYSESDLRREIDLLNELVSVLEGGAIEDSRTRLMEYFRTKVASVLGGKNDKGEKIERLLEKLQGIQDMEMVKPFSNNYILGDLSIEDLKSDSKLKPEMLTGYRTQVIANLDRLNKIRSSPHFYEIAGDEHQKYFWVPMEDVFN